MYRNLRKRQVLLSVFGLRHTGQGYLALSLLVVLPVLLLAACGSDATSDSDSPAQSDAAAPPPPASPVPPSTPISPTATLSSTTGMPVVGADEMSEEAVVTYAQQMLADHLGVVSNTLTLSSTTAPDWSDSALGCPAPEQVYLQVITPGYLLVFRDNGGQTYDVHTTRRGTPLILCQNGRPVLLDEQ